MKCPKCGSEHTQFVTNTIRNGPSVSRGCCGWILFGPVGLLCSFCGTGSETEEYWICHSCGSKFQAGEYEKELKRKEERVDSLKTNITKLEKILENKPEDLDEQFAEAYKQYQMANDYYDSERKAFINSSGLLKFTKFINTILNILSLLVIIFGLFMFVTGFSEGDFVLAIIIAIVFGIIALIIFSISEGVLDKAMRYVDSEKANKIDVLWRDLQGKEKHYKELKRIKDNINSHDQKVKELDKAKQELNVYKGEDKKESR